jgi:hypothetical protein
LAASGCVDLDVMNPDGPDREQALTSPEFLAEVAHGSIRSWWNGATDWSLSMLIQSTADALTSSFCHARFDNLEPRIPFNNSLGNCVVIHRPWAALYTAAHGSSEVVAALDRGALADDPAQGEPLRAAALLGGAAAHATLALLFDQAFVVTSPVEPGRLPELQPHTAVRDSAMRLWDDLIALTDGKSWQLPTEALPLVAGAPTAERLHRIARTMAARTLVLSARTGAENVATDWARVLAYADGGLTGNGLDDMDFALVDDGGIVWYDYIKLYGSLASWMQVDQRLINRMAPNIPVSFAGLGLQPAPAPADARLATANLPCTPSTVLSCTDGIDADYVYLGFVVGDPSRGVYMQSPFWHRRYAKVSFHYSSAERAGGALPHVLAAENDLMIAEALLRTGGDLTRAASLVNKTRVGRGALPPVAETPTALLAAIEYERDVELLNTGAIALFDRRRVDGIQTGTLRHFPVPATELEALGLPVYTFGGVGQPDT